MSSLFKSTLNTRFLPVKDKCYIRSDCPYELSQDEIRWLIDNHITTIVDLREEREYIAKPCCLEKESGFKYYHLMVTGGGCVPESYDDLIRIYLGMLDEKMDEIISTIMDSDDNVLYFCTSGKDRTGVVSALILNKYFVDEKIIIDDYMQSKDNLAGFLEDYVKNNPHIDINILIPNENNIITILNKIKA